MSHIDTYVEPFPTCATAKRSFVKLYLAWNSRTPKTRYNIAKNKSAQYNYEHMCVVTNRMITTRSVSADDNSSASINPSKRMSNNNNKNNTFYDTHQTRIKDNKRPIGPFGGFVYDVNKWRSVWILSSLHTAADPILTVRSLHRMNSWRENQEKRAVYPFKHIHISVFRDIVTSMSCIRLSHTVPSSASPHYFL